MGVGFDHHYRMHHSYDEFVQGAAHINGIESFWNFAKSRLHQFAGVAEYTLPLHLEEGGFRFNHRYQHPGKVLLKKFRQQPLKTDSAPLVLVLA